MGDFFGGLFSGAKGWIADFAMSKGKDMIKKGFKNMAGGKDDKPKEYNASFSGLDMPLYSPSPTGEAETVEMANWKNYTVEWTNRLNTNYLQNDKITISQS